MRAVIYTLARDDGRIAGNELKAYAEGEGFEVVGSFLEPASKNVCGDLYDWPAFYDCLECCRTEHADVLMISTLSDLGDSSAAIVKAVNVLSYNRIPLYIKDIDVNTIRPDGTPDPAGVLVLKVLEQASRIDNEFFSRRLNAGRERYKESGGILGRPKGTGMTPEQTLEKYPGVASRFDDDTPATIDEIAAEEGVSPSTVKKVKKAKKMLWLEIGERFREMQSSHEEAAMERKDDESVATAEE